MVKKTTYSHHITGLQITGTPSAADHGFPPMVQQETMENLGEGTAKPLKGDVKKWRNIEAQQQTAKLIEFFKIGHSKRGKVMKSPHISWWSQHFPMVFPWFSWIHPPRKPRPEAFLASTSTRSVWRRRTASLGGNGGYHRDTGNIEGIIGIIGIIYGE